MSEACEFLDRCGFFLNYRGNTEVIKQGWIRMYCENQGKSKQCERRKVREETGQPPADNMCPTGRVLWG